MLDARIRSIIEAIHASPTQAVIYVAGGASQALGWLLSVPGASNTVLEALVPYSRASMSQLLGKIPAHFTSQQVVEEMAILAYNRALKLSRPEVPVVGVGFTGSLATASLKHGDHRFFLSTRTSNRLWVSNVTLCKGLRTREEEDKVSSNLLLKAIADACEVCATFDLELSEKEMAEEFEKLFDEDQELQQLLDGEICLKIYPFDTHKPNADRKVMLSGSFNPLHDGHLKLLEVASSMYDDRLPCFEISAVNADKPPLSIAQIKDRVKQFGKVGKTVIVSNQPYFYKKAEVFPGTAFVIGADTAARLINPKYYGDNYHQMLEVLNGCKRMGCSFLVGGRKIDGAFKVLEDFGIPEELKDMFVSIPQERFQMDISSTQIRKSLGI
uniref:Putative nicotinate-nucleotide adenylyltransferase n=1 Tax=Anthurium amnicola TaxID=1678845 RepID=A0A1D1XTI2_9ARAE